MLLQKTITGKSPEEIDLKYKQFAETHKIKFSQPNIAFSEYGIYGFVVTILYESE